MELNRSCFERSHFSIRNGIHNSKKRSYATPSQ